MFFITHIDVRMVSFTELQIISWLAPVKLSGQIYFCSDISHFFHTSINIPFFPYQHKRPDKLSGRLRIWPDKTYFSPDIVRWPAVICSPDLCLVGCLTLISARDKTASKMHAYMQDSGGASKKLDSCTHFSTINRKDAALVCIIFMFVYFILYIREAKMVWIMGFWLKEYANYFVRKFWRSQRWGRAEGMGENNIIVKLQAMKSKLVLLMDLFYLFILFSQYRSCNNT